MPRLCVLPADPITASVRKGEIKARYFNPEDLFDEIHVVTTDASRVDESALGQMAGAARAVAHPLGPWHVLSANRNPYVGPYLRRLVRLVGEIRPDVIRCYTPVESGWLARAASRAARVPYVVSIHGNYDLDVRERLLVKRRLRGLAYFALTGLFVEPKVLRDAAYVICAYEFAAQYVRRVRRSHVEVVYNRVSLEHFRPAPRNGPFTVLFVGRCDEGKGQELLIAAMRDTPGELVLVGDGPTRLSLERLAASLGLRERVHFIPSVPHAEMPQLFARASCYASAIFYGGIQIPHLEAMASALPLVLARPVWEREPEQMADVALVVERSREAVAVALRRVAEDRGLADELAKRALARARELSGDRMERREREIYERVLSDSRRAA